ncbi:mAFB alternative [Blastococcus sp. TF02-8]|uniref:mAFB alternative n=1 Tax=Blastococcus sp. TF02-8 TaxID=2250574 RepID=UPI0011BE2ABB|nr:mAFB alternative [Blastococcus sp. TF02-8]
MTGLRDQLVALTMWDRLPTGRPRQVRLRAQLASEEIAGGHAFNKHVVQLGEFSGVTTRAEFASVIENTIMKGESRSLSGGRVAYWNQGVVVIRNPNAVDGGTAFRPTDGYDYYTGLH